MANLSWMQMIIPVFLTIACGLSVLSVSYCHFVAFPQDIGKGYFLPKKLEIGFWGHSGYALVQDINENIWKVDVCYTYSEAASTNIDGTFEAARVFAIMTPIFGIISSILWCCEFLTKSRKKLLCIPLLLTTIFSGLSLLVFSSNVCNTKNWENFDGTEQSCILSNGSIIAITNTILYFLSAIMVYVHASSASDGDEYAPGDDDAPKDEEVPKEEENNAASGEE
mmetsp:Transcript_23435/g.34588  ORF Transcript_23435/g.34588 Transcript_23435/m.34588 type:complete len:224 (+) Transcript_23435:68-739(+)